MQNYKTPRITKAILRIKEGQRYNPPRVQTVLQSYSNQTMWYWHKNRHIDHWNRMLSPEINPCTYGKLINDKGVKNIQWRKDSLVNKYFWESWTAKSTKLEHSLTPYTKLSSKQFKDINIRHETIKLLDENIGKTFSGINCNNIF